MNNAWFNPNNPLRPSFPRKRESSHKNRLRSGQHFGIGPLHGDFLINWIPTFARTTNLKTNGLFFWFKLIKLFFACALTVSHSYTFAAPPCYMASQPQAVTACSILPKLNAKKAPLKNARLIASPKNKRHVHFHYDAKTLQERVASTSILTHQQVSPYTSSPKDEQHSNFDGSRIIKNKPALRGDSKPVSFYALLKGQAAQKILDFSEAINPDEIYASTYYPDNRIYADQGYILNLETRINLPDLANRLPGLMQLIVFVDTSAITMNQSTLSNGLNRTTINGGGAGVNWTYMDHFEMKVYFANELDDAVLSVPPVLSTLFWVQAVGFF